MLLLLLLLLLGDYYYTTATTTTSILVLLLSHCQVEAGVDARKARLTYSAEYKAEAKRRKKEQAD